MGGNYAPAILPTEQAKDLGCSQVGGLVCVLVSLYLYLCVYLLIYIYAAMTIVTLIIEQTGITITPIVIILLIFKDIMAIRKESLVHLNTHIASSNIYPTTTATSTNNNTTTTTNLHTDLMAIRRKSRGD